MSFIEAFLEVVANSYKEYRMKNAEYETANYQSKIEKSCVITEIEIYGNESPLNFQFESFHVHCF